MLLAVLVLIAGAQTPKTFEELEIAKLEAFHGLKNFHQELVIDTTARGAKTRMRMTTSLDGARWRTSMATSEGMYSLETDDGALTVALFPRTKQYLSRPDDPALPFDAKSQLLAVDEGFFSSWMGGSKPMLFSADPPPTLLRIEDVREGGERFRKATATWITEFGHGTLTQWFMPDRWILKRFLANGVSHDQPAISDGRFTLDFHAKFAQDEFKLDPAKFPGYTKTDTPPPG